MPPPLSPPRVMSLVFVIRLVTPLLALVEGVESPILRIPPPLMVIGRLALVICPVVPPISNEAVQGAKFLPSMVIDVVLGRLPPAPRMRRPPLWKTARMPGMAPVMVVAPP